MGTNLQKCATQLQALASVLNYNFMESNYSIVRSFDNTLTNFSNKRFSKRAIITTFLKKSYAIWRNINQIFSIEFI